MNIVYQFNGYNFKDFGVYVSLGKGLIGKPKRKKPNIFEYPDESGYVADLKNEIYEPRIIELFCFIKAATINDLIDNYNSFTSELFSILETKQLQVNIGTKSLNFLVYVENISDLDKIISDGMNVGTFTVKLIEPDTSIYEKTNN